MARTVTEIQNDIIAAIQADTTLGTLNSTSATAVWRLFTYVVASAIWTLETIYDLLRTELNNLIATLKPHTLKWYAGKCLAYQHGFNLLPDSDKYNNTGYTDAQIAASKVVKYAAVVENVNPQTGRTFLRIKAAADNGDLTPLSAAQLSGFKEYLKRIKDAGVPLQVDSLPADSITMSWDIYYDPLILNASGGRLDGSVSTPVRDAIKNYLKNMPFNGTLVLAYLVDAAQAVDGVVIPQVTSCNVKYGALPFTAVQVMYVPDAGYLRFVADADLVLNFIPQTVIK